jgi:hypothetical protein
LLSLLRVFVGVGISPLAQAGLNEALDLAVSLWRIGLGANVPETETLTGSAEGKGPVAGAVVGHHALDANAELAIISNRGLKEGDRAGFALIGHDLHEGDARGIVDTDVDELPSDAVMAVHHTSLPSGDAMPHRADAAKLFDIEMDEFARLLPFIATDWFGRLQGIEPVEPTPSQNAADGGCRDAEFAGDLLAGVALSAQSLDRIASGVGSLAVR